VIFTGAMDYLPNVDAVEHYCTDIFPAVSRAVPGARFLIVGLNPTSAVRRLGELPGVTVTGAVPDVRPYYRQSAVSVAPLRIARGIQNKVLEAMAMGRPVITTDAPGCRETVIDGDNGLLIPTRNGEALADAMLRFLSCPGMIDRMAKRSVEIVREKYCSRKVTASMLEAMSIGGKSDL